VSKPVFQVQEGLVHVTLVDETGEHEELFRKLIDPEPGQARPVYYTLKGRSTENKLFYQRLYLFYTKEGYETLRPFLEEQAKEVEELPKPSYGRGTHLKSGV
jgi:hypothetical protein